MLVMMEDMEVAMGVIHGGPRLPPPTGPRQQARKRRRLNAVLDKIASHIKTPPAAVKTNGETDNDNDGEGGVSDGGAEETEVDTFLR